jgi:thiol-disulfide isomerase/thioredoxin
MTLPHLPVFRSAAVLFVLTQIPLFNIGSADSLALAGVQVNSASASGLRLRAGMIAPEFKVSTLDGKPVSLSDYRGRPVLVNFWATWCGACKVEMPWLAELREKYAAQGFEVLGVVTDKAPTEKIVALERKYGVHYPILLCNHAAAQAYGGLPDLPESFFLDRRGSVAAIMDGADSKQEIEGNIQRALSAK